MAKKKENPIANIVETVTDAVGSAAGAVGETVGSVAEVVTERVTSVVGGGDAAPKAAKPRASRAKAASAKDGGDDGSGTQDAASNESQLPEHLQRRRTEVGRVVSDKMQRTVVVQVQRSKQHPIYKKVMRQSVKFMAHDEMGAGMGDTVRIMESRPMSKHKRWRVIEIMQRAE